ncbi:hypothetical protein [Embleya sp. NPDC001921]
MVSPARRIKRIRSAEVGLLNLAGTQLTPIAPETRVVVYTPADEPSRERLGRLMSSESPHTCRGIWPVEAAAT